MRNLNLMVEKRLGLSSLRQSVFRPQPQSLTFYATSSFSWQCESYSVLLVGTVMYYTTLVR